MEANRKTYSKFNCLASKRLKFDPTTSLALKDGDDNRVSISRVEQTSMSSTSTSDSSDEIDEILTNITSIYKRDSNGQPNTNWKLTNLGPAQSTTITTPKTPTIISREIFYPSATRIKSSTSSQPSPSTSSRHQQSHRSTLIGTNESDKGSPVKITICDSNSDSEEIEQSTNNVACQYNTPPKQFDSNTSTQIDRPSLKSLDPGRMLNDTIIEFYMDFVMANVSSEWRNNIHVFNTFIYNKLKSLQKKVEVNGDSENSFCQTIKRWDKHVRLFDKKFLIMPICDHSHWIMIIICYPEKVPAHDEPIVVNKSDSVTTSITSPLKNKFKEEPCILIFDSLGFKPMTKFTEPIRSFLTYRWKFERPNEEAKNFKDRSSFRDVSARVPRQRNTYDCGIHMLVSFERFVERPVYFYEKLKLGEDVVQELREPDTRLKRHKIRSLIPTSND